MICLRGQQLTTGASGDSQWRRVRAVAVRAGAHAPGAGLHAAGAAGRGSADAFASRTRSPKAGSGHPFECGLHAVSRRYLAIRTVQRSPNREDLPPGAFAEASAFPQRHMPSRSQATIATGLAQ